MDTSGVIEIDGLRKRYGDTVAVDDVDLEVAEGEILGILGPNGAGKTTLVECVEGLRAPDAGRVRVLGLDPQTDRAALRQVLGVQLQESRLPERLRVGEAVRLYRSFYRDGADPEGLLTDLGLTHQRDTAFEDLSGGQQQRLSIALALVGDPQVAVLDELTTGLDPHARRETWDLIRHMRERGVTVVLVTHFMDEAERLCDRVAIIDDGRVVADDTPAALVSAVRRRQRLRFRPSGPLDPAALVRQPEVTDVSERHGEVTVTGEGELLQAVTTTLAQQHVAPLDLTQEQATLEDAFVALTGRRLENSEEVAR